jgi:recombinational DNA repair protein RecT
MARKTVYRRLIGKWGVMSIDYQNQGEAVADLMKEEFGLEQGNSPQFINADITEVDTETGEVVE